MKKTLFFSLALAAICIMPSCKKSSNSETIVIGDSEGMIVTTYDSTFLPYTHTFNEDMYSEIYRCGDLIDLNGDGVEDIQLISVTASMWDYHNSDLFSKTSIMAVNNALLSCESVSFNRYSHHDTTDIILGDTIRIYETMTISCEKIAEDDFCEEFSGYQAIPYSKGNHLSKTDISPQYPIYNPSLAINFQPIHYSNDPYPIGQNTIRYSTIIEEESCSNFPLDIENYIGFKTTDNSGDEKLGWIKFKLISQPDGTHRLRLLESAIQE